MVIEGLEAINEAVSVHSVVLFPGPTTVAVQTARRFQLSQLGNVTDQKLFDKSIFGNVHSNQVTPPYLVSAAVKAGRSSADSKRYRFCQLTACMHMQTRHGRAVQHTRSLACARLMKHPACC